MKKFITSLLSIIFIISMITNVYAATGNISAKASADTVIKGKTFTVTLAATADSPIDGMYTKINYDKQVLSLESANPGENYGNNSSDGEILVTNSSSTTSPTEATLYTITFKVLDNANVGSTTISFSESELHLNVEGTLSSVVSEIANITINVKADDTTVGGDQGQGDPSNDDDLGDDLFGDGDDDLGGTPSEEPEEEPEQEQEPVEEESDDADKKDTPKLPQTGAESTTLVAIIALGVVAIISYISYRKYNNI